MVARESWDYHLVVVVDYDFGLDDRYQCMCGVALLDHSRMTGDGFAKYIYE